MPGGRDADVPGGLADRAKEEVLERRLRGLRLEAAVHGRDQASGRASLLRGRPRGNAPAGDQRSGLDGLSPGNGRASLRDAEMADGRTPLPGAWLEKGQSRIGTRC